MLLLNDSRLNNIECENIQESMVSLKSVHYKIEVDETKNQISNESIFFCYARETLKNKLIEASENLPANYKILVKEAYRNPIQQKMTFNKALERNKKRYPEKNKNELYEIASKFVAPVEVAGHCTGGAVDVTLIKDNAEVYMGSGFNEEPVSPKNLSYTKSKYIDIQSQDNRELLLNTMESVGFVNYPTEWWHFSYGDIYWAFIKKAKSLYNVVPEDSNLFGQ